MTAISSAALGMTRAAESLDRTASRVAHMPLTVDSADRVDLSREVLAMMQARSAFAASARVAHSADELERSVLNLLG